MMISKQIFVGLTLTTLVITPYSALDPFNLPKMVTLVCTAFIIIGTLFYLRKEFQWKIYKPVVILVASFNIWLVFILAFSGSGIVQQLYGANGRNIGFITLFALSVFFVASVLVTNNVFMQNISKTALLVGAMSIIYELVQVIKLDPINWVKITKGSFGFQGNPNFQSSLIGMIGVVAFTKFLLEKRLNYRVLYLLYLLLTVLGLIGTESKQGFLVLLIGSGTAISLLLMRINRTLGVTSALFMVVSLLVTFFGLLNKGPLAPFLYGDSIALRGDFWRASWRIIKSNPIFGIGIDSFEKGYLRNRDALATTRRPRSEITNAAHNSLLDFSSAGGLPLLLIYCLLVLLVLISAYKVIRRSQVFDSNFLGLLGAWVGFQAQSMISVNQIGIAVWGWVLSGLIVGFEMNTRDSKAIDNSYSKNFLVMKRRLDSPNQVIVSFISVTLGLIVSIPPFMTSAKYKSAIESTSVKKILEATYLWPREPLRMSQTALILNSDNFKREGLMVAKDAVSIFPDDYSCWAALYKMDVAEVEQKAEALLQMKRLNPQASRNF
jgi:O-antigen ligase